MVLRNEAFFTANYNTFYKMNKNLIYIRGLTFLSKAYLKEHFKECIQKRKSNLYIQIANITSKSDQSLSKESGILSLQQDSHVFEIENENKEKKYPRLTYFSPKLGVNKAYDEALKVIEADRIEKHKKIKKIKLKIERMMKNKGALSFSLYFHSYFL